MHLARHALLGCLCCGLLGLARDGTGAPDAPKPKSARAQAALRSYEAAVGVARREYDRAVATALKELTAELDVAKRAATRAEDLDEANRIAALVRELGAAGGPAADPKPALTVRRAGYGAPGAEADITAVLRAAVAKSGRVRDLFGTIAAAGVPDPSPGRHKTITITGTYGGQPFVLRVRDGTSYASVEFGPP